MTLRTALQRMLAGWQQDLPSPWREATGETDLSWTAPTLDRAVCLGEIILPGRKATPIPDAPQDAHIFRAFDNLTPAAVRVVLLGQDPYPKPAWATGRAFEQGNLNQWPERSHEVADSLRRMVQAMVAARTGNPSYAAGDHAWAAMIRDAQNGSVRLDAPREFFDRLEHQGVLCLNTSLTVSMVPGTKECYGHFDLWSPFLLQVLSFLAARPGEQVLFLLFGRRAQTAFDHLGRVSAAKSGGQRIAAVRHWHPAAIAKGGPAFLKPPNPFATANDLLRRMGVAPICW